MPLESLVYNSHAVCPSIPWEVFIPMSLECLVRGSHAVHPLLLGEFLGSILLDCLVYDLCAVHPLLFLGNFCSHFILVRLCILCMPFFCHFSLEPSASFPSECLLCVSLALFFIGATLSFAHSVGAPSKYFFCRHDLL